MHPACRRSPRRPRPGISRAPGAVEQRARLLDRDLPEREDYRVGALVAPAEIAVAEMLLERDGIHHPDLLDGSHGPAAVRECHAGYTRPGKVLHPRAVRGIGIDRLHFRPGLGRVPPIMEEDLAALVVRGPFGGKLLHGAVAAVAVADHDALEAAVCHAVENVAHQRE